MRLSSLSKTTLKNNKRSTIQRRFRLESELLEDRRVLATWVATGPGPIINGGTENVAPDNDVTGAIQAVVAHPTNPDTLYIGSVNGGVWKTTNATATRPHWTPLTDTLPSLSIGDLEMDPTNPNTLLAGIGRASSFGGAGGALTGLMVTRNAGTTWTQIKPAIFGDREFSAVYVSGDLMLAASNGGFTELRDVAASFGVRSGGLFRSADGGQTWTSIEVVPRDAANPTEPAEFNAFDLVGDPTNPNRFYISVQDVGVFRSDNAGVTWADVTSGTMSRDISTVELGFDPMGVLIRAAATPGTNNNTELAIGSDGRIFAGILENGQVEHIAYSSDNGQSWTQMDLPFTPDLENNTIVGIQPRTKPGAQGLIHFSLAVDPNNSDIVYIGGDRQGGDSFLPNGNSIGATRATGRLFRGDVSVEPLNLSFNPTTSFPFDPGSVTFGELLALVSPQWDHLTDADGVVFAPGGGTLSSSAPHADSRGFAFDANGNMLQVDDGGIYRRTNPQSNQGDWFSVVGDLTVTEVHSIAYDSNSNIQIAGVQDNGTIVQVAPGSVTWESIYSPNQANPFTSPFRAGGDGGDVVVDDTSTPGFSTRYSSSQNLGAFRRQVYDANNQLVSQQEIGTLFVNLADGSIAPIDTISPGALFFVSPLELNRVDPTRILAATRVGLFESANQGDSFFIVTGTDPNVVIGPNFRVEEDPVAMVYGGFRYGVANQGLTYWGLGNEVLIRDQQFQNQQLTVKPFPGTTIRDLTIDDNDWTNLFVIDQDSVYFTTDLGTAWADITGNLNSFSPGEFRSLVFIPGFESSALVVGTDRGVYVSSTNNLGVWTSFATGLPNAPVYDMEYDRTDDVLVAGTLGRGTFIVNNASAEVTDQAILANLAPSHIYGKVLNDTDSNRYQNNGETGLGSVVVFNDLNNNGRRDSFELFTTTAANGSFALRVPGANTYRMTVELPTNATFTSPLQDRSVLVQVDPLDSATGVTFTLKSTSTGGGGGNGGNGGGGNGGGGNGGGGNGGGSNGGGTAQFPGVVSGSVYFDANNDNIRNNGESSLTDASVYLDVNDSCVIGVLEPHAILRSDGSFTIMNVAPGTYKLRVTPSAQFNVDRCDSITVTIGDGTNGSLVMVEGIEFGVGESPAGANQGVDWGETSSVTHGIRPNLKLGASVFPDGTGESNPDDNDGVFFSSGLQAGTTATVTVVAMQPSSARGFLQAWIDFNGNGVLDASEQILKNVRLDNGSNVLTFAVPANIVPRNNILARFRWGWEINLGPTGPALFGEVEDYRVSIPMAPDTGLNARDDSFMVDEDSMNNTLDVLANDLDRNGGVPRITAVGNPTRGTVTIVSGGTTAPDVLQYTPTPNVFGTDTFTYTISNANGSTSTATVTVLIADLNDPPVPMDDAFVVNQASINNVLDVLANDTDPENDPLTITGVTSPSSGGSAVVVQNQLFYSPDADFTGVETFDYTVSDGSFTRTATVTVTVRDVDALMQFRLVATDTSGTPVTSVSVGEEFFINAFVMDLRDNGGGVFQAYLDVTYPVDTVDVNGGFTYGTDYPNDQSGDTATPGVINEAGAADGLNPLGTSERLLWRLPMVGIAPGMVNFAGDPADILPIHESNLFNRDDAVPTGLISFVNTSIDVVSGLFARNDTQTVVQNSTNNLIDVLANDVVDAANGPLMIVGTTTPGNGMVVVANGFIEYTPNPGYLGIDTFSYTIRDTAGNEDTALVTITVEVAAVTAVDDMFTVIIDSSNNSLDVLMNDLAPLGNFPLSIIDVTSAANGSITFVSDSIQYTPNADFVGTDTFQYTIEDSTGDQSTATVTVNVERANVVSYALEITDTAGNLIDSIEVGQEFQLRVYTQDLRSVPFGVFAGYLDVLLSGAGSAEVTGPITYGPLYPNGQSGDTTAPTIIDELGAFDGFGTGFDPQGERKLLATVPYMATGSGPLTFTGNPADLEPTHFTLVFNNDDPVAVSTIVFGMDMILITSNGTVQSPLNNADNPFDVDQNGIIAPGDALLIINDIVLNGSRSIGGQNRSAAQIKMVDVNNDFFISAQDALWVINQINNPTMAVIGNPNSRPVGHVAAEQTRLSPEEPKDEDVVTVGDIQWLQPPLSATTSYRMSEVHSNDLIDAAFGDGEVNSVEEWESAILQVALDRNRA